MYTYSFLFIGLMILSSIRASAQEKVRVYSGTILNQRSHIESENSVPKMFFYAAKEKHSIPKVFLIIPGGGYGRVAMNHEGHDVAKRLIEKGHYAFVLRYRLPKAEEQIDKRIVPIQDAQAAFVSMKSKMNELGVKDFQSVVMGFSAGGHLASTVATHYNIDYLGLGQCLRPDYSVLLYPVISMDDEITHSGSKNNLIGPEGLIDDVNRFSNELHVTNDTPPTFIMHSVDDKVVPIQNAYRYRDALQAAEVKNYFYQFEKGGHGFGMVNKLEESDWFQSMLDWLKSFEI